VRVQTRATLPLMESTPTIRQLVSLLPPLVMRPLTQFRSSEQSLLIRMLRKDEAVAVRLSWLRRAEQTTFTGTYTNTTALRRPPRIASLTIAPASPARS